MAWRRATLAALLLWSASAEAQESATKELRIASLTGYSATSFPNNSWDWGAATLMPVMFDALTEVEAEGKIVPALATAWRAEDHLTWVFELRKDVRFSNGEPFTAEAVARAVVYLQSAEGKALILSREVENIAAIEPRGDYEVIIRTHEPDALLPARMRSIYMLPPKHFDRVGKAGFIREQHGSGPFKALRLAPGKSEFVANPYAWRKPKVDRLTFFQVGESLARIQAVMSGGADIAFNVGPGADSVVAQSSARVDAVYTAGVDTMPFITVKDSAVRDPRVRLALNLAVDKARMAKTILDGRTQPATQFAPKHSFGYDESLTEPFARDIPRAKALLAEAGYAHGLEVEIELYVDGAEKAAIVQQVASDFADVGVKLKITTSTVMDIQERGLYGGRWAGQMMNLPYFAFPSFDALAAFSVHSCSWVMPFHCDEDMTSRIKQARKTFNLNDRLTQTRTILRDMNAAPPALLLFDSVRFFVVGPRVTNYRAPFGIIRYHEVGLK